MTKITITVESDDVSPGTGAPSQSVQPAAAGAGPPPDVLAQAAATGAINAGPGPRMADIPWASAPIASSVSGTVGTSSADVVSGGAAPQRLLGMQQDSAQGGDQ
jgi:hypothetical protein